jgi:hypothetical protein
MDKDIAKMELEMEVAKGEVAAAHLCIHALNMGCAKLEMPVTTHGYEFFVTVEVKPAHPTKAESLEVETVGVAVVAEKTALETYQGTTDKASAGAVEVTAADFNGTDWDGSPFTEKPDWLVEAVKAGRIKVHPSNTDYAMWTVQTPKRVMIAGPGDWILHAHGQLLVAQWEEPEDIRKGVPMVWPEEVQVAMDNAWRKATDTQRKGHFESLMAVGAAAIRGMYDHKRREAFRAAKEAEQEQSHGD